VSTTTHDVDLRYTRAELHAFLAVQRREDVEWGGRYDGGTAAINVWSHSWVTPALRRDSSLMGTFFFVWADEYRISQIECAEGFSLDDLLHELAILERKALDHVKHGREQGNNAP
jgi:hypothetical protein